MLRLLFALAVPYVATQGLLGFLGCSYLVGSRPPLAAVMTSHNVLAAQVVSACYRFSYLSVLFLVFSLHGFSHVRQGLAELQTSILNERYLVGKELQNIRGAETRASGSAAS